jgi:hypothetical protein
MEIPHFLCWKRLTLMKSKTAVLLAGAHSGGSNLRDVYVLSLAPCAKEAPLSEQDSWSNITTQLYKAAQQANVEVRVGYFGLCARLIKADEWACIESSESLLTGFGPAAADSMDIMSLAERFKSDVVLPWLMSVRRERDNVNLVEFLGSIGAMALSLLSCVGLSTLSRATMRLCISVSALASALILVAALWQHIAAACAVAVIGTVIQDYVVGHVGTAGVALV